MLAARRLPGDAPAGPTLPLPAMGTSSCPIAFDVFSCRSRPVRVL